MIMIELTYPHEFIIGISGECYKYEGSNPHIRSLKFTTNTSEYGPLVIPPVPATKNSRLNSGDLLSLAVSMGLTMHPDYSTSVLPQA
ncbi:hypothetical protein Bca52824_061809 [Brassica carinata]|uniref:Jacalin-type lectin domain-containing protein n=1 Tax=Brassica carinata TaxID=52824 RepID=A0A8X7U6P0_BRACI|nr:hypothetical protein Bca52824_061809 [Brassica carinata]